MKKIITILILIFTLHIPSQADDIRDFQIEGMSIGDSLLDFMGKSLIESEIKNKTMTFYYEDKYVSISAWKIRDQFEMYDDVGIVFDPNDNKYEILALEGTFYYDNIDECYRKQNEVSKEIKKLLKPEVKKNVWFVNKERLDDDLLSLKYIDFNLDEAAIRTSCYDVKDKKKKDILYVIINSSEFNIYLNK